MNVIKLITTKGCYACKIAENLINRAIVAIDPTLNIKIDFQVVDCFDDSCKDIIKEFNVTDFPATVFIKDDYPLGIYYGTMAVPQIINLIKLWFS